MAETANVYQVKTTVFEGPLDVLLRLIEERKLFINEISLAGIADEYIAYVQTLPQFRAGEVTSFLLVAATLVLIKSKSLLPSLELTQDEQTEIVDLERRLRLYKLVRDAGMSIKSMYGKHVILARDEAADLGPIWSPDETITTDRVLSAIEQIIASIPKKEFLPEVTVKKVISIEEMMGTLADRIQEGLRTSFSAFSGKKGGKVTKEEKVYVIVSFLAMLELVRQGLVNAMQEGGFEEITLEKQIVSLEISIDDSDN